MFRSVAKVNYRSTGGAWPGLTQRDYFAVRWSGVLMIKIAGSYRFAITSDDGSNLFIEGKKTVSNDGLHGMRTRYGTVKNMVTGQHKLRLEFFERGGGAGMIFKYKGADTRKRYMTVPTSALKFLPSKGFKQEIYYFGKKTFNKVPNLNINAAVQRTVSSVNYAAIKGNWRGFTKADNFAVRWSGDLKIRQRGSYRFSLKSDDGSKLFFNSKLLVNNDGLHGMRQLEATASLKSSLYRVILEFYEKGGLAGMIFKYMGPQTRDEMVLVPARDMTVVYHPIKTPVIVKKVVKKIDPKAKKKSLLQEDSEEEE